MARIVLGVLGLLVFLAGIALALNKQGSLPLPGSSLQDSGATHGFSKPVAVGQEWLLWDFGLLNTSGSPLVIENVSVPGPGMGSVVDVVRIEMEADGSPLVIAGIYEVYPPASGCRIARLRTPEGLVLGAGESARIAVWLRAARPGRYRYPGYLVRYRKRGLVFEELVQTGQRGSVEPTGEALDLIRGAGCTNELVEPLSTA
jgi:hypothetical protein